MAANTYFGMKPYARMNKLLIFLAAVIIGCHNPLTEPHSVIFPIEPDTIINPIDTIIDPIEEAYPLDTIRMKLGGTYHGIFTTHRIYYDTATSSSLHEYDTMPAMFTPIFDTCSISYLMDSIAFTISNINEIYHSPLTFCFTEAQIADTIIYRGHYVHSDVWSMNWNVNENRFITTFETSYIVAVPPFFTTSYTTKYQLTR